MVFSLLRNCFYFLIFCVRKEGRSIFRQSIFFFFCWIGRKLLFASKVGNLSGLSEFWLKTSFLVLCELGVGTLDSACFSQTINVLVSLLLFSAFVVSLLFLVQIRHVVNFFFKCLNSLSVLCSVSGAWSRGDYIEAWFWSGVPQKDSSANELLYSFRWTEDSFKPVPRWNYRNFMHWKACHHQTVTPVF